MAKVSVYLNFPGNTEEAFNFYKKVFGTEFDGPMSRFSEIPEGDEMSVSEADKDKVMHVSLPLLGDFRLMGTDATESMGFKVKYGNNSYINLEPDTRQETDRLFAALSEGGKVEAPLAEVFWGDYFG